MGGVGQGLNPIPDLCEKVFGDGASQNDLARRCRLFEVAHGTPYSVLLILAVSWGPKCRTVRSLTCKLQTSPGKVTTFSLTRTRSHPRYFRFHLPNIILGHQVIDNVYARFTVTAS